MDRKYLELLENIKNFGTFKPAARENMPSTKSLFGYQFRHNLSDGFPLLTTKRLSFKHIVTELLWFMKGDTNVKYLIDNGCNIWNQDAYNYYLKKGCQESDGEPRVGVLYENIQESRLEVFSFEKFVEIIKYTPKEELPYHAEYTLGDCGAQYGRLWRNWEGHMVFGNVEKSIPIHDQLKNIIEGLRDNPTSRRHIITAWNPDTLDDMALHACHALVQFNCRPITIGQRAALIGEKGHLSEIDMQKYLDRKGVPKYYLDCQMYQRSADVFLGVPYNIASYSLLTEILAKGLNMIAGEFVHTFGDVHIYENHTEQVDLQLSRTPKLLPTLHIEEDVSEMLQNMVETSNMSIIDLLVPSDFNVMGYMPHPSIKAELSTGMKKSE